MTQNDAPSGIWIESPTSFLVCTFQIVGFSPANGHVFRVTHAAGAWTATQLTSTPVPFGGLFDVTTTPSGIYAVSSQVFSNRGWDCRVWHIPLAGGTPTQVVDLASAPHLAGGLGTCITAVGSTLHVLTFNSTNLNPAPEHWTIDTSMTPHGIQRVGILPRSQRPGATQNYIGAVTMDHDPVDDALVVCGVWGEVLWRGPDGTNLRQHAVPTFVSPSLGTDLFGSLAFDERTGHVWLGDRGGWIEDLQCADGAFRRDLIQVVPSTTTWINALAVVPGPGSHRSYGAGCPQGNGMPPCSGSRGAPVGGSAGFAFYVRTPSSLAILLLGASSSRLGPVPLPVELTTVGAPGCWLRTSAEVSVIGTPAPGGFKVDLPLPVGFPGPIFDQWLVQDSGNALGYVLSGARELR